MDLVTLGYYPTVNPMLYFFRNGRFFLTNSVVFSKKLENIKRNSKVSLLICNQDKELHIFGNAQVHDENLDTDWLNFKDEWFQNDEFAKKLWIDKGEALNFWKRVLIEISPQKVIFKEGENTLEIDMELI